MVRCFWTQQITKKNKIEVFVTSISSFVEANQEQNKTCFVQVSDTYAGNDPIVHLVLHILSLSDNTVQLVLTVFGQFSQNCFTVCSSNA